ncbi:MAG TPA: type II secretion system F family protein [Stellaceae bacterium]|nr:type II secretion system F family protein [Stellaceae bacterium]
MTLYRFEAVAASGELVRGEMEAGSKAEVVERLQGLGHLPIRADTAAVSGIARRFRRDLFGRRRLPARDLALLTQQLATLLQAGLGVDRALEIAETVLDRAPDRERLRDVLARVRGGSSLADAIAAQPGMVPKFYVGMVRAGEAGASLDRTLRHLGAFLERSHAVREQIRSALIYPAIVLAAGSASVALLFGFVVPRFRPLFEQAGGALPLPAEIVLGIADFLAAWGWWLLVALAAAALGGVAWLGDPARRAGWDRRILGLPVLGPLATKLEMARLARTLGTLLENGVPPLGALAIARETSRNSVFAAALEDVAEHVKEGKGLAEPLAQSGVVPPLAVHLVRVGEETARLEEMLLKIAEIYEEDSRRGIERLLALLVPGITVLLGLVVALVVGSILSAVLSAYELAL